MNQEQVLAEWMRRETPAPPRAITIDVVAPRVRPRRPWVPMLAAACVVAVVATLIVRLAGSSDTVPAGPTPSNSVPTPSTTAPTTDTNPSRVALAARPWGALSLNAEMLSGASMLAHRGSLYAVTVATDPSVVRMDASGRVLARSGSIISGITALGDVVWAVPSMTDDRLLLCSFDAQTLKRQACWSVPMPGAARGRLPVVASGNGTVYVGAGVTVAAVDPASGAVRRRYEIGETVTALAPATGSAGLYVGYGEVSATVTLLDLNTGVMVRKLAGSAGVLDLAAGNGGVFVARAEGGHVDEVYFISIEGGGTEKRLAQGGGGSVTDVGTSGGAAWVGGHQRLVCADPATGAIRAQTGVGSTAEFTALTALGAHVYAVYSDGLRRGLAELRPPAACGLH